MGQEFVIKSTTLEDKINQLLPSQGGFQAGVDLSASTTIIPIIDLTESAEGSNLRVDLQSALDTASTSYSVTNATNTVLVNTTGFFRVFGTYMSFASTTLTQDSNFNLFDGATANNVWGFKHLATGPVTDNFLSYDFIVFLKAWCKFYELQRLLTCF